VGAAAGVMGAEPGDHVDGLAADVLAALPVQRAGEGPAEADLGLAGRLQADPGGLVVGLVELDPECAVEVLGAGAAGARRGDLRRPGDDDRPVVLLGGLDALAADRQQPAPDLGGRLRLDALVGFRAGHQAAALLLELVEESHRGGYIGPPRPAPPGASPRLAWWLP